MMVSKSFCFYAGLVGDVERLKTTHSTFKEKKEKKTKIWREVIGL
jgi:hypothetical protein